VTDSCLTSERARELGKRSGEARRARVAVRNQSLDELAAAFDRDGFGARAFATADELLRRVAEGEVPNSRYREVGALISTCFEIGRLEAGQPTSHAASVRVRVDESERRAAVEKLRIALDAQSRAEHEAKARTVPAPKLENPSSG
jgi:hypothetical protein